VFISGEDMFVRARSAPVTGGARAIAFSPGVSKLSTYPSDANSKPRLLITHTYTSPLAAAAAA
jgi:hypothetical protein